MKGKQRWLMRVFLRQNNVSCMLAGRIEKYLDHRNKVSKEHIQTENIPSLKGLSEELARELAHAMNWHHVSGLHFLGWIEKHIKVVTYYVCCTALEIKLVAERELIFKLYDEAKKMYFLKTGSLRYIHLEGLEASEAIAPSPKEREPISEGVLWTDWAHMGKLISLNPSDLICVNPDRFIECMHYHQKSWSLALIYAKEFIKYMNEAEKHLTDIIRDEQFTTSAVDSCEVHALLCDGLSVD